MNTLKHFARQRTTAILLIAAAAFLAAQLFVISGSPIYVLGDAQIFMLEGQRMAAGQLIYRDFFEFLPPGIVVFYAAIFRILGAHPWVPNLVLLVVGIGLAWVSIIISRHFFQGTAVFLPALMFLVLAYRNSLDGTHHWFSTLAVLAALAMTMEKRDPARLAVAGALCGIASDFTTPRGALAVLGFALFVLWEACRNPDCRRGLLKREAALVAGFAASFGLFNLYFVWKVGFRLFFESVVVFAVRYYPAEAEWNTLRVYMADMPRLHPWYRLPGLGVWLFVYLLQPLVYFLFFARAWQRKNAAPSEPWEKLMLVNVTGLALFAGIASAPCLMRLCSTMIPALILFVWFVQESRRFGRALISLIWIVTLVLALGETFEKQVRWKTVVDAPVGRMAILAPEFAEKVRWLAARTRPKDYFFDGGGPPGFYFPLELRDPAGVPYLTNSDFTRPEQVQDVIAGLGKHKVKYVLWPLQLDVPKDFPANDRLGPLRKYLCEHYRVANTFDDAARIWERVR